MNFQSVSEQFEPERASSYDAIAREKTNMIDISKLTPKHVNRLVVYRSRYRLGSEKAEQGRITSWNDRFIFVDYSNVGRGQATSPEDLEFV